MSSRTPIRVAVLLGGLSAEREVSLVSGSQCAAALRDEGYHVIEIDAGQDLPVRLAECRPDVAFNALHGRWGEDGCVQGILEWMRIPYTHSGVSSSALAMNKHRAKLVYQSYGIPVAESFVVTGSEMNGSHPMDPPYVIKPVNEGSSVGVQIIREGANAPPELGYEAATEILVEKYIPGKELTVSVMNGRALTITDIQTSSWYDYSAKYEPGGSRHVIPAEIPDDIFDFCMERAEIAHNALGCRGLSRTDIRWQEERGFEGLAFLETNTQPGMTPTSLAPEQASHCGISFGALCRMLVEEASCDR